MTPPPIQISETVEEGMTFEGGNLKSSTNSATTESSCSYNDQSSLLTASQISEYSEDNPLQTSTEPSKRNQNINNAFTPRTEYLVRQTSELVERICEDNGVVLQKYSFSSHLIGREDDILKWSAEKHESVLKIIDYLQKRAVVEREYSNALQKLNRQVIQNGGDPDERLGQLVVIGEKTAAGHLDISRKINEHTLLEDLKTICNEHETLKRRILADIKRQREIWRKSALHIEKIRNNRDKLLAAVDAAQATLDSSTASGNLNSSGLRKIKQDLLKRKEKANVACQEYNQALKALTLKQKEIFRDQLPNHYKNLERVERTRISSVRSTIINVAQTHLAIANIETESGERWLNSLVSTSVDDEIENFVKKQLFEKPSTPGSDDIFYLDRLIQTAAAPNLEAMSSIKQEPQTQVVKNETVKLCNVSTAKEVQRLEPTKEVEMKQQEEELNPSPSLEETTLTGLYANLTSSEGNLLESLDTSNILAASDPIELMYKKAKLESLIKKLSLQIEGLNKMKAAYESEDQHSNSTNVSTIQVICKSINEISKEVQDARELIKQIDMKTLGTYHGNRGLSGGSTGSGVLSQSNPMMSILEEMNKLEERRKINLNNQTQHQPLISINELQEGEAVKKKKDFKPKRSLSKSFEDLLQSSSNDRIVKSNSSVDLMNDAVHEPELNNLGPEIQRIFECTSKFNERIKSESENENNKIYEEEEELLSERRIFRKRLGSAGSTESNETERVVLKLDIEEPSSYLSDTLEVKTQQFHEQHQQRRRSIGQSTPSAAADEKVLINSNYSNNLIPLNSAALFRVQSLYNFIGRKETDELDLRTGEILTIYDATGEWWEAENEVGTRGYIPFNYVIKI